LFGQLFGMKKVSVRLSSLIVHAPHWSIMRLALTGVGELPVRVDVEYQYLSVILVVLSNNLRYTCYTEDTTAKRSTEPGLPLSHSDWMSNIV